MVTDSFALICDARLPAVLSTVITLLYFVIKLGSWLVDSFHAIPDKTQGPKVMPTTDRNQDTQGTTKRSQSDTETKLTDSGHQEFSTDNGLRVRTASS